MSHLPPCGCPDKPSSYQECGVAGHSGECRFHFLEIIFYSFYTDVRVGVIHVAVFLAHFFWRAQSTGLYVSAGSRVLERCIEKF